LFRLALAKAQPMSIILKLFKLAVRVIQYKGRIKLSLPTACPMKGGAGTGDRVALPRTASSSTGLSDQAASLPMWA
jgi:hypothetical protein